MGKLQRLADKIYIFFGGVVSFYRKKGMTIGRGCEINKSLIFRKDIVLVDDIYTEGIFVAEDCIQTLFDFGAKSVTLYVMAKTRS